MGIVFDIQRCSINDGPGIRTTVFLKGCPLRCIWCHNPESLDFRKQLSYTESKCISCMKCIPECVKGCHLNDRGLHKIANRKNCIQCGKCVEVCTTDALTMIGKEVHPVEVMREVQKDRDYYDNSKGGMTISGGEPFAQFNFTKELLTLAKELGIHTCVDPSGFTKWENIQEVIPLIDLFLFDYKVTEEKKHRELTGVDNKQILFNLDSLYKRDAKIILRCPMIPGINDSEEHLQGIAALDKKYKKLMGIEIMPYHNMGVSKGKRVGLDNMLGDLKNVDEVTINKWLSKLRELGATKITVG